MTRIATFLSICCAALVAGCASNQTADVSPGLVADSAGSTKACCSQCPATARADQSLASPGAVSECTSAKSGTCTKSADAQCPFAAAKAAGSSETVSPGAVSGSPARCGSKPACGGK